MIEERLHEHEYIDVTTIEDLYENYIEREMCRYCNIERYRRVHVQPDGQINAVTGWMDSRYAD